MMTPDERGKGIPWALMLTLFVLALLIAQRSYYLIHFGFAYTDGDQTAFWYQAEEIAQGIVREPCLYGQSYNVPIEAWAAAPLLILHTPAYIALPVAATALGVLPFLWIAWMAYRRGQKWAAAIILLIPLALPMEYTVVASLPRGFINGLAICTPAIVCWIFFDSYWNFFLAGFFAVLAMTVNPNCSIVLLAVGIYALLKHYRLAGFYFWSLLGATAGLPAPLLISRFYQLHPECDAYHPKASMQFTWQLLRDTLFEQDQPGCRLNHWQLDLFFGHFVPIVERGWIIFCVLILLIVLLLLVRRWRAAAGVLLATSFTIWSLGVERIHSASDNVFYSGSRMFLAIPVLVAVGLLWFDAGVEKQKSRCLTNCVRGILIVGLLLLTAWGFIKGRELLDSPSPLVVEGTLPPVEMVDRLKSDSLAISLACAKYHVDLVLINQSYLTCMDDAGPVISNHAFNTLSPFFERRTYLIKQERQRKHLRVLVYLPTGLQRFLGQRNGFYATMVSDSPRLLLVEMAPPGLPGMEIASKLGIPYRERF